MLKVNHFDEKHHINGNVFKFCITWQQNNNDNNNKSLKLLTKLHYLHLDVVTPGIKRNDIWQMDSFFLFCRIWKTKYIHHTIDTYAGFQWATALISEKVDCVILHGMEIMAVMALSAEIKTDNVPSNVSNNIEQFFAYYKIKHVTGVWHNPTR